MKTALITGGTSGIGKQFAYTLAKIGYKIIITGRDNKKGTYIKHKLDTLHKNDNIYLNIDLTNKDDLSKLQQYIKNIDDLEFFINGAGFIDMHEFLDGDESTWENMILLHNLATTKLCYSVGEKMKKDNIKGKIINIASIAAFLKAGNPLYAGTKSYLRTFSLNLNCEFRKYGIYVQALCPGPVETNLWKNNIGKAPKLGKISVENVVKKSLFYAKMGRCQCIPGFINKITVILSKLMPKNLIYTFSKGIMRQ